MTRKRIDIEQVADKRLRARLETAVAQLPISQRTINLLDEQGIVYVHELLYWREDQLLAIDNFGPECLKEVFAALEVIGFFREKKAKRS